MNTQHQRWARVGLALFLLSAVLLLGGEEPLKSLTTVRGALATPIVITFEEFPVGTNIRNQYLGTHGVTFSNSRIIAPSQGTASGKQALETATEDNEFDPFPLVIEFTSGQSRIKMAVGNNRTGHQVTAVLRAFDSAGNPVGSPVSTFIGSGPSPITTPMEVKSNQANIRRVELNYQVPGGPNLFFKAIDNLEFDTVAPPPPDTQAPVVKITKPQTGDVTDTPFFQLQGTIKENTALADVRLTIEQSGKSPVSYQIDYSGSAPTFTFGGLTWMGVLFEGQNTITVKATDISNNRGQDSVTVSFVKPPPPTIDLFPIAMEITQGINSVLILPNPQGGALPHSGLPLVARKRTVVRVYGGVNGATGPVNNVLCYLTGLRNGVDLPGAVLSASPDHITLNPANDLNAQRANINLTWNFVLPDQWTQEGTITLIANVNPGQVIPECPNCYDVGNSMNVFGVNFQKTAKLHIYPIRVCVRRSSNVPQTTCDLPDQTASIQVFTGNNSIFSQVYPVADGDVEIHTLSNPTMNFDGRFLDGAMSSDRMSDLLGEVQKRVNQDTNGKGLPVNHVYVAMVPPPITAVEGLGLTGSNAAVFKVAPASLVGDSSTAAQEVGHTIAFNWHAPSDQDASGNVTNPDCQRIPPASPNHNYPQYLGPGGVPYPRSSIGQWGLDTRTLALKNPANTYDFMSYCDPKWVSPFTHFLLFDTLKKATTSSVNVMQARAGLQQQEYLLVTGEIDLNDQARLDPSYRFTLPQGTSDERGRGEYSLELQNQNGQVLFTRYFDPALILHTSTQRFRQLFPFIRGTVRLLLRHGGAILATKMVSRNAPVVTILSPNGGEVWDNVGFQTISWVASDADGDALFYTVQYSADGGQNWVTLATDLTETQLQVDAALVAGSRRALIRVLATDGVNTGSDTSDAPFSVMGKPPLVTLLSPRDGASYVQGHLVSLQGMASDLEDGPLGDERLTWLSDRDGLLGKGRRLDASALSPGRHKLTLMAEDSDGNRATESVNIEILPREDPSLRIELANPAVTPLCNQGASHTIRLNWRAMCRSTSCVVGPLILTTPDGQAVTFDGPFPSVSALVLPVNFPAGGSVRIRLEARDDAGARTSVEQSVTLGPCRGTGNWEKIWGPASTVVVGWVLPDPDRPGETTKPAVYATKLPEGDIYVYNGTPGSWTKIGGPGKKFVTHGNRLYGLSPDGGGVFKYTGTPGQWTQIGGPAGDIYGGLIGLFATNPQTGDIYAYNCSCGGSFRPGWTKIGGPGKMFAVSAQHVYGLSPDGSGVWQFDFNTMRWARIGNAAASIYAGGHRLYATNPQSGNIWEYNEDTGQWAEVGGPGLMFAVDAFKGELYGLSPDGSGVYKYTGTPGQWTRIGDAAASIYAGWPTVYATNPTTLDLWRYVP